MQFVDLKAQYQSLRATIDARIRNVLEHGEFIMGPEVAELERQLATFCGARHCITVASGTEALLVAMMAIGIEPGDEVITTPFSFIATAEMIVLLGAKPVFVDIEPDTCNIDASLIARKITPKTRAIMPVSLYGQPSDMDAINEIASAYGLAVIEDGAQSFGANYKGRKSCNLSTIGCTSFFPSKPLGCYGDGGAIFTSEDSLAQAMREIRVHGQRERYVHSRIGVGGRMDTLQCAIVLAKLERLEWELQQRSQIGTLYNEIFGNKIRRICQRPDRSSVFAQYTIVVEDRRAMQAWLKELNIPTAVHYPLPIPKQQAYEKFDDGRNLPVAFEMSKKVLSLPMGPYMDPDSVARVAQSVLSVSGRQVIGS